MYLFVTAIVAYVILLKNLPKFDCDNLKNDIKEFKKCKNVYYENDAMNYT